ncbi:MAG: hypothetical protein ACBR12_01145 [Microcoleus sp.]
MVMVVTGKTLKVQELLLILGLFVERAIALFVVRAIALFLIADEQGWMWRD